MRIFYLYFILLFLSSSLYLTESFNSIGNTLIAILILMFIPIVMMLKKYNFVVPVYSFIIMFIFLLIATLSALINGDVNLIATVAMIVVLYLSSFIITPSFGFRINEVIYKATMISHLPLIIFPLLIYGFDTSPYKGIFYNPNSFGSIVATLYAVLLAAFLFKIEKKYSNKNKQKFSGLVVYMICLFAMLFLVVVSGSRTSLLATVILTIIGFTLVSISFIKSKNIVRFIKSIVFNTIIIGFVLLLIKVTPFYDYLYRSIIYKFENKSANGDVLDGRGQAWRQTINDAGLFGNGTNYFGTKTLIAPHNTFINILGEYGWITLIIFILFMLYGTIVSLKYALSSIKDEYKYMPIILIACFTFLSIGESMLFKFSMIAMFFSLGTTVNLKNKIKHFDQIEKSKPIKNRRKLKRLIW